MSHKNETRVQILCPKTLNDWTIKAGAFLAASYPLHVQKQSQTRIKTRFNNVILFIDKSVNFGTGDIFWYRFATQQFQNTSKMLINYNCETKTAGQFLYEISIAIWCSTVNPTFSNLITWEKKTKAFKSHINKQIMMSGDWLYKVFDKNVWNDYHYWRMWWLKIYWYCIPWSL